MSGLITEIRRRLESLRALGFQVWLPPSPEQPSEKSEKGNSPREGGMTDTETQRRVSELQELAAEVAACRRCVLGSKRKNPVFGVGSPNADLVFIGEAPGATEDETGLPFVGAAGNLLTQELAKHGISRDEVYICNILKCRPPGNRDPLPDEIQACEPYLLRQLDILKPKMLCGLGRFAVMTLLRQPIGIMKIRGTWQSYHGIPLFVSLHPAAVLHRQQNRSLFEADMATLAQAYHQRWERLPVPVGDSLL
jgi:DNA polymerase